EPLLLGRPFLATGRALIDVERGELMLRTDGEQIMFSVFEAMKRHEEEEPQCYRMEIIEVIEDKCKVQPPSVPVERVVDDSIDAQEAEWNREIEIFLQQLED
ncbi:hypothetical protein A2U01_0070790, partial [Trifolium medium]|nr:hypothetical protein [Trifolium medium]